MTHLPGYWMDETSGVLRPAIEAYLHHREMTPAQIAAMQAYLRQWISAPCWSCDDDVADLRTRIDALTTMKAIASWLDDALDLGIDPL